MSEQKCIRNLFTRSFDYDIRNKPQSIEQIVKKTLRRTVNMFEWNGLPDSIPQRYLELMLQIHGHCCITRASDGNLYAVTGNLGETLNPYYVPTRYIVANPYLTFENNTNSASLLIGSECVFVEGDSLHEGIYDIIARRARQITENEITLFLSDINARIMSIISADNTPAAEAGRQYLKDIERGNIGVIADMSVGDWVSGIKASPFMTASGNSIITQLIELNNYYNAEMFNDLGLPYVNNFKRESLNDDEVSANNLTLLPLIDDMLLARERAATAINKLYGTEISVKKSSSWAITEEEASEVEPAESAADVGSE